MEKPNLIRFAWDDEVTIGGRWVSLLAILAVGERSCKRGGYGNHWNSDRKRRNWLRLITLPINGINIYPKFQFRSKTRLTSKPNEETGSCPGPWYSLIWPQPIIKHSGKTHFRWEIQNSTEFSSKGTKFTLSRTEFSRDSGPESLLHIAGIRDDPESLLHIPESLLHIHIAGIRLHSILSYVEHPNDMMKWRGWS